MIQRNVAKQRKWIFDTDQAVQRSALCRSRRELSNAYFLAKFRLDTAENEPSKICRITQRIQLRAGARARGARRERRGPLCSPLLHAAWGHAGAYVGADFG